MGDGRLLNVVDVEATCWEAGPPPGQELAKPVGMAQALSITGLPPEGRHHRGDDDAWNIAALILHLASWYCSVCCWRSATGSFTGFSKAITAGAGWAGGERKPIARRSGC
jgi:inhibitor of KinA sporulation pathway (predicted exonuclease)